MRRRGGGRAAAATLCFSKHIKLSVYTRQVAPTLGKCSLATSVVDLRIMTTSVTASQCQEFILRQQHGRVEERSQKYNCSV